MMDWSQKSNKGNILKFNSLNDSLELFWMQDGVPPHWTTILTDLPIENLLEIWIEIKVGLGSKSSETYAEKNSSKPEEKNLCLGEIHPPKPPVCGGLCHPHRLPGIHLQATGCFKLNPRSQLVIGCHWLPFLNYVHKNLYVPIHKEFWVQNRPFLQK